MHIIEINLVSGKKGFYKNILCNELNTVENENFAFVFPNEEKAEKVKKLVESMNKGAVVNIKKLKDE